MTRAPRDHDWMGAALSLAKRGLGECWPNPSVGCVVVKNGRVIGRGRTQAGGRPHAEVVALQAAGQEATGATVYVTLEPCSHHGHSPPCTDALIEAAVAKVVVGADDPNPKVSGIEKLRASGIEVLTGVCADEAEELHRGFFSVMQRARPFLTLKLATTLDGRIATHSGESRWITGPAARRRVHLMRAASDAVLIGRGTAEADDPMLDVREMGAVAQPVRVILDRKLSISAQSRLITTARLQPTWIVHSANAVKKEALGDCTLIGASDIGATLEALAHKGLTTVLCEGGGRLAATLLKADLVDELVLFTAGKAIGGDGIGAIGPLELHKLTDAPKFELKRTERIGNDTMSVWRRH